MALKYEEREIDSMVIGTKQFPAVKGFKVFTKIGKMLTPIFAHLGPAVVGKDVRNLEKVLAKDISVLAPALQAAFVQLEEAEADKFIVEILSATRVQVQGKWLELSDLAKVNAAFEGEMATMVKAAVFALEVNYADFIGGVFRQSPSSSGEAREEKDDSSVSPMKS